MIGKLIGAALGRRAARSVGNKVGGPAGAAIGYGLASRRFRKLALGGLAAMGGLAAYRKFKEEKDSPRSFRTGRSQASIGRTNGFDDKGFDDRATVDTTGTTDAAQTNKDPLPAYAPHS